MSALTRRELLLSAAALPAMAQRKDARKPNIVVLLADDLAAFMLGCYGNKEIRTPNIDLLARQGMRFANAFAATPAGSPSRVTLFTGRLPSQHGVHDTLAGGAQAAQPAALKDEVMISDLLAGQGYNCGYVGRWYMGDDARPQHGFKYWCTLSGEPRYQNPALHWNGAVVEEKGYLPEVLTQRACQFIEQQTAETPFFLVVGHLNPHGPYEGHPAKYSEMYAKTNFETIGWRPAAQNAREKSMLADTVASIRKCAAVTTALDDQIRPVIDLLNKRGLRGNTLVIFTADNGQLLGRHGLWGAGMASDPPNMYDEALQTPMIWNWPGKIPVEAVRPEMVSFYDVMPSLCELTGSAVPQRNLAGRSYLPIVRNRPLPKNQRWDSTVFGEYGNAWMVRDPRFKLILRNEGKGPNELYDVRNDPREQTNQYENAEFITVRDALTRELTAWRGRLKGGR